MPTRDFTRTDLARLGVPPDSPEDVEWSETILSDTHVCTLKYSQKRRCVFTPDDSDHGESYAVEYEAPLDLGDFEVDGRPPANHGWHGDTVTATRVVKRTVVVDQWQTYIPDLHDRAERTALEQLTEVYEESGIHTADARRYAAELLAVHTAELEDGR